MPGPLDPPSPFVRDDYQARVTDPARAARGAADISAPTAGEQTLQLWALQQVVNYEQGCQTGIRDFIRHIQPDFDWGAFGLGVSGNVIWLLSSLAEGPLGLLIGGAGVAVAGAGAALPAFGFDASAFETDATAKLEFVGNQLRDLAVQAATSATGSDRPQVEIMRRLFKPGAYVLNNGLPSIVPGHVAAMVESALLIRAVVSERAVVRYDYAVTNATNSAPLDGWPPPKRVGIWIYRADAVITTDLRVDPTLELTRIKQVNERLTQNAGITGEEMDIETWGVEVHLTIDLGGLILNYSLRPGVSEPEVYITKQSNYLDSQARPWIRKKYGVDWPDPDQQFAIEVARWVWQDTGGHPPRVMTFNKGQLPYQAPVFPLIPPLP